MAAMQTGTSSDEMIVPLLAVRSLRTEFDTSEGKVIALDDVSFEVFDGETVCLVGESGCGKSLTSLSILGLLPKNGRVVGGQIMFDGVDLAHLPEDQIRHLRGSKISMIFQEPMTSLNPVLTVGSQIAEAVQLHQQVGKRKAWEVAVDMLRLVGLAAPERRAKEYPHQFSGGMRQRVMIAMALACRPKLLIADEPTTALDVTIQAQVLDLITRLKQELGMAVILITHDLGVVAETAQRVCVMYAGKVVEMASVSELFANPQHPYTRRLLKAIPGLAGDGERLQEIPGTVPPLWAPAGGCGFCPRFEHGDTLCRQEKPAMREVSPGHFVRCWAAGNHDEVVAA